MKSMPDALITENIDLRNINSFHKYLLYSVQNMSSVCMYLNIYVYIYVCMYVRIYVCTYVCKYL